MLYYSVITVFNLLCFSKNTNHSNCRVGVAFVYQNDCGICIVLHGQAVFYMIWMGKKRVWLYKTSICMCDADENCV